MAFQVIVHQQLRGFEVGRQRLEFMCQSPVAFGAVYRTEWLEAIERDTGFSQVLGQVRERTGSGFMEFNYPGIPTNDIVNSCVRVLK